LSANAKQSRAAVARRNVIVPQMRDYDELGMNQEWVPYLMYFHPRSASKKSVSTDQFGARNSVGTKPNAPTALLVGGSSVFGIGATSDSKTIPSLLNTSTKYNWSLMSGSFSPMYGAFFHQGLFEQQMKSAAVGNRALTRQLIAGLREKFGIGKKPTAQTGSHTSGNRAESYKAMLTVFERDCEYINMLAKHNSTSASFVLQPFAPWINKSLTSQEVELFELLDQEAESFSRILIELAEHKAQYARDVEAICTNAGLKFLDLNIASELQQPEWLFVDRVHLTDAGYSAVAKLLVRDLSL
jgi:hypothetical protein